MIRVHLLAFAVTAFVIIVIPGPSVMFIVGRALALDKRAALESVLGNSVGEYVQVVIVALGAGLFLERSVLAFQVLKFAGAAYLVWLGVSAWRSRDELARAMTAGAEESGGSRDWHVVAQGISVGASNPKSVIFLSAVLPQFVHRASGHVPLQILLLGSVFSGIARFGQHVGTYGWSVPDVVCPVAATTPPRRWDGRDRHHRGGDRSRRQRAKGLMPRR